MAASLRLYRVLTAAGAASRGSSAAAAFSTVPVDAGSWPALEAAGVASHLVGKVHSRLAIQRAAPVQAAAMPVVAAAVAPCPAAASAYDVVLHAPTGSGKTLAYLLPLLGSVDPATYAHARLRVVIVTPTRELAVQVADVASSLALAGKKRGGDRGRVDASKRSEEEAASPRTLRVARIVGEVTAHALHALTHLQPHVLIGTPASLAAVLPTHVNAGEVAAVVLDEADECARNHHAGALATLLTGLTRHRHRPAIIAVSATPSQGLNQLLQRFARVASLRRIDLTSAVEPTATAATGGPRRGDGGGRVRLTMPTSISHWTYQAAALRPPGASSRAPPAPPPAGVVDAAVLAPYRAFTRLLAAVKPRAVLCFANSTASLDALEAYLRAKGVAVAVLGAGIAGADRSKALGALRQGQVQVLLSTEMAARGLDLPRLSHIINFDLPHNAREYVHRAGRVGRLTPGAAPGAATGAAAGAGGSDEDAAEDAKAVGAPARVAHVREGVVINMVKSQSDLVLLRTLQEELRVPIADQVLSVAEGRATWSTAGAASQPAAAGEDPAPAS